MPRPQFTLRALLVAMLVVAAFFGGAAWQRHKGDLERDRLNRLYRAEQDSVRALQDVLECERSTQRYPPEKIGRLVPIAINHSIVFKVNCGRGIGGFSYSATPCLSASFVCLSARRCCTWRRKSDSFFKVTTCWQKINTCLQLAKATTMSHGAASAMNMLLKLNWNRVFMNTRYPVSRMERPASQSSFAGDHSAASVVAENGKRYREQDDLQKLVEHPKAHDDPNSPTRNTKPRLWRQPRDYPEHDGSQRYSQQQSAERELRAAHQNIRGGKSGTSSTTWPQWRHLRTLISPMAWCVSLRT